MKQTLLNHCLFAFVIFPHPELEMRDSLNIRSVHCHIKLTSKNPCCLISSIPLFVMHSSFISFSSSLSVIRESSVDCPSSLPENSRKYKYGLPYKYTDSHLRL